MISWQDGSQVRHGRKLSEESFLSLLRVGGGGWRSEIPNFAGGREVNSQETRQTTSVPKIPVVPKAVALIQKML